MCVRLILLGRLPYIAVVAIKINHKIKINSTIVDRILHIDHIVASIET